MAMVSHSLSLSKTHLHTKPSARRAFHVNNMSVNKVQKIKNISIKPLFMEQANKKGFII